MSGLYGLLRPLLFQLAPETAHRLTINTLKTGVFGRAPISDPALAVALCGITFPNPVGLAAGFDKDAEVPKALLRLGFGFVEVGTLTPRAQPGNPRPRMFRLVEDRAVINRLGFNNGGHEAAAGRIAAARPFAGPVGINVGANKDSEDRTADYVAGVQRFAGLADYLTINISSPNTPGLRALQSRAALTDLIGRVRAARRDSANPAVPLWLKIAPDLTEEDREDIVTVLDEEPVDALIISNTTIDRPDGLRSPHAGQAGGLSGAPLMAPSTEVLRDFYARTGGRLPLIGVGGIMDGADAYAKIRAGASLVQLYSGLVYGGPGLVQRIKSDLVQCLKADGFSTVAEAIGADHRNI